MTGATVETFHRFWAELPIRLLDVTEENSREPVRSGGWNRKQILGHLLDSCLNNHYRIARAVLEGGYSGPSYAQDGWVAIHRYDLLPWPQLVSLWTAHNALLLHMVDQIEDEFAGISCAGGEEQCTLSGRLDDYVSHLQHHLSQIVPCV